MKKLFGLIALVIFFAAATTAVYASGESNCQVVYGGGEVCQEQVKFTINKMVESTTSTKGGNREYVENLTINDARYGVGQNVNFKIVVENTGDTDIHNLNVVDTFPELLTFVAGAGVSNTGANKINFTIGTLAKGEKKEIVITAKTADNLPDNQTVTCVTNNVKAYATNGAQAEDNAQVCIEKLTQKPTVTIAEKPTVEKIPSTGPEMGMLFGLIPAGLGGALLRKKFN
jgi:uncharacterized repeat protein (TIGR01451 family)